jgi:hypothetical protein
MDETRRHLINALVAQPVYGRCMVLPIYMGTFPLSLLLPQKLSIATTFLPMGYIPPGFWLDKNRRYQKWK